MEALAAGAVALVAIVALVVGGLVLVAVIHSGRFRHWGISGSLSIDRDADRDPPEDAQQ